MWLFDIKLYLLQTCKQDDRFESKEPNVVRMDNSGGSELTEECACEHIGLGLGWI